MLSQKLFLGISLSLAKYSFALLLAQLFSFSTLIPLIYKPVACLINILLAQSFECKTIFIFSIIFPQHLLCQLPALKTIVSNLFLGC